MAGEIGLAGGPPGAGPGGKRQGSKELEEVNFPSPWVLALIFPPARVKTLTLKSFGGKYPAGESGHGA